jgi:hypothetical protein
MCKRPFPLIVKWGGRKPTLLAIACASMVNGLATVLPAGGAVAQALIQTAPLGNSHLEGDTLFNGTEDGMAKRHKGPTGKPCISVVGDAHPQKINPQIYDHLIIATNVCGQNIRLNVCYYHSEHCVSINVSAYSDEEAMLGIMPSMKTFRFEYREIFNPFGSN